MSSMINKINILKIHKKSFNGKFIELYVVVEFSELGESYS